MLRSFAHYYKPHWKLFVFDMICALIAAKMDGSLTLDSSYAKGTRFVLELHT